MIDEPDEPIEQALARLRESLLPSFEIGGLFTRNAVAHKWKATTWTLLLREAVFWRLEDLLQQSYALHKQGHTLGALILLRSALETLATLIYLNQLTASVLDGSLNFHEFGKKIRVLLLGSRNEMTTVKAINIQTVLEKCAKRARERTVNPPPKTTCQENTSTGATGLYVIIAPALQNDSQ